MGTQGRQARIEPLWRRLRRYERLKLLTDPPPAGKGLSQRAAGRKVKPPVSGSRVAQILAAGRPQDVGRPRGSRRTRGDVERLAQVWRDRAKERMEAGLDPSFAESRAAALETELAELSASERGATE